MLFDFMLLCELLLGSVVGRLEDLGYGVGLRMLELLVHRDKVLLHEDFLRGTCVSNEKLLCHEGGLSSSSLYFTLRHESHDA